jgi:hypothetical protein
MLAGVRRNDEVTLGRRVQLTITQAYLCGECATVAAEPETPQPAAAPTAPEDAADQPALQPQPAPAFAIGGCEPTAVMEFPVYTVAASPTVPSQR